MALAENQDKFKKLKTVLVVISTDGLNSHIEWVKSMNTILSSGTTPVKIEFPIVADIDYKI